MCVCVCVCVCVWHAFDGELVCNKSNLFDSID